MLPAFGNNCNCLFVVAGEHTDLHRLAFRLKRNTITDPELQQIALADANVQSHIAGKTVKKVVVVKSRLVSIVV